MLFHDQAQIFFLFNSGFFLNAEKHIKKNPSLLPLPPLSLHPPTDNQVVIPLNLDIPFHNYLLRR
jgi:hypothetical protein